MRILFVLSQRPELTGSGITLDALVRAADATGHQPWVLCGVPADQPTPTAGGLQPERILTVRFGPGGDLPYPVPGMSDVMPYASTIWSAMTEEQLAAYREVWRAHLQAAVAACRPDLVHCNHLWLVSALAPDILDRAGGIPSVAHCHATGLRQMELCPHLRDEIIAGLRPHRRFLTLHADLARRVATALEVPLARVDEVGAGYGEDLFHTRGAATAAERRGHLLFVGKYAEAKGLPWLLDACEALWREGRRFTLHIAGDGTGPEAEALRTRMRAMDQVVLHGRLGQTDLGRLMRQVAALVLPSLYEGLPLVLAEARACGCRLLSTALTGVVSQLAPVLGEDLVLVEPPRLVGPDTPVSEDLPAFTARLAAALREVLAAGPAEPLSDQLAPLTWQAVYQRVEAAWREALA